MVKVDIISGFLGAGKTTLIKKLFESKKFQSEKVVIIENEFGEIGIDGSFLKESGVQIKEINAGCICCSLVGDFESSIKELIEKFNPDRIIIEPSGVGKLSDIIVAVQKVQDVDLKINILATVVDAGKAKVYLKNFGEFFDNQIQAADTVVVGKVDKVSEEKLIESVNVIKGVNQKANVITTAIADLNGDKIVEFLEEKASLREELIKEVEKEHHHEEGEECDDPECSCHHHHDDDDEDEDEHEHHCCHHHHDDDDDEDEDEHEHHCCHHHHDDDDEDEDEHEHHCCHNHHDDDDEEDEHEHEHHHHHEEAVADENGEVHHHIHRHHHHHHHDHDGHDADEVFQSWGLETPRSFTKDELEGYLKTLCDDNSGLGIILRSKGIVKAADADKWYYFDLVAGDYDIRLGEPDYTGRIVVIGSGIDDHKLDELFSKKGN